MVCLSAERKIKLMAEALDLAARAEGKTSPNPVVGAVVLDAHGEIVGRGWHRMAGEPHAEVLALQEAGDRARGGVLILTLEPCSHQGRTPPCAPFVVAAGVSQVIAAVSDPNPRVSGKGFAHLRANGVEVEIGVMAEEAVRQNEAYFHWWRRGQPFLTLKAAASLDGKIATRSGQSRWITGEAARNSGHHFRNKVDAILVGVETVLKDDPLLTARPSGVVGKALTRVVLDSRLRTPSHARILAPQSGSSTILAATEAAPLTKEKALRETGAEIIRGEADLQGRVSLAPLLESLGRRGIRHILVEGGGRVHGSFIREGLADRLLYFVAPLVVGDSEAPSAISGLDKRELQSLPRLFNVTHEVIGDDLLIQGYFKKPIWQDIEE
ncbi:MAG: bifunctional diaminohydroxyphosphoribosylaminopyrimidine deaminase/5-amino-6-(5-phosphoribosylamino)uracil reductase RibD [Nitrospinae bacterium]|nr:bifunctional diaminohydroxyphosphoribosylaminopyrimidine deaminase/5-amino-6-(5-phosphoribosylamino)uracil reductase RibD [Nitrospinota bacterium]